MTNIRKSMQTLKYGNKIIYMEGIITEVHDGGIAANLNGRLGSLRVPMRMVISDNKLKIGQKIGFNMSFIEQINSSDKHNTELDLRKE